MNGRSRKFWYFVAYTGLALIVIALVLLVLRSI
jgi:hypothetical protein